MGAAGGAVAVVIAIVVGIMSMSGGDEDWNAAILYTDLDYWETAEITNRLTALGIPYKLTQDATAITVPDNQVRDLRLTLAGDGYPKSGTIGYEIFDEAQLAMTDFLQNVNHKRALQGELEKTLSGIDDVRNARVHLVMPEQSLFSDDQDPTTASVTLTLASASQLRQRQVESIGFLVSASVEGLHFEDVVIIDSEGNLLSEEVDPLAQAASRQFQQQQKVEQVLQTKVQTLLDEVIGKNRSNVRINVALDFSRRTSETSTVEPGATQVVLSEETNEKNSAEQGTEENAVRNYEVNRLIESTIGSVGEISQLSMALTVDKTKVIHDVETNEFREVDRADEEIKQLEQLAKQSIGFDESRGDEVTIFALRFDKSQEIQAKETAVTEERREFWTGVAINVAKVLGILAALITLRFIIQAIGRGVGVEEEIEVLGEISDIEEEDFERPETPHDIILSRVQQMVRERPEDAAKLIRTMLVEDAG
jgi:flagellar M-ring protein FliF